MQFLRIRNKEHIYHYFRNTFTVCAIEIETSGAADRLVDGRITLSIPYKKRRRLVRGKLEIIPISSSFDGDLSWEYEFTPNNVNKLQSLITA